MTPRERFAINLRKARQKKGISQEELGFRCDLHRTEISLLERGGREPRLGTIVKLCGSLDTTPGQLCEGVSWNPGKHSFRIKR
ncbi:MAG TPA: helix-turn-helix transcriptional regulator [Solirubrobacterales bacterium]|nr:helix-turn-helix transcriptional regulator [Solirubrobacterales bacterium]